MKPFEQDVDIDLLLAPGKEVDWQPKYALIRKYNQGMLEQKRQTVLTVVSKTLTVPDRELTESGS